MQMNVHHATWDQRYASFDKLRMRCFLDAIKISPHPELVEGRTLLMPANTNRPSDTLY
jgi:hypothetical protein